jgi:aryl-alcohol dehydrogenase-like predicted oxidoreductase
VEKRALGKTGLKVTVLGFGGAELRGPRSWSGRPLDDEQAGRVLNAVLDAGVNLVDTAPDYGPSESLIGRFTSARRDSYYLATKCGCVIDAGGAPGDKPHEWTRDHLMQNIETSLKRLRTDYVDLWQPHNPSMDRAGAEALVAVMEDVKRQGKVRHIGISSTRPHIGDYIGMGDFETFQIPYSALDRAEEQSITAACASGAGTIIRGGVAQGEPGAGTGSTSRWATWDKAKLDELRSSDESRTAFLLRFTISHPNIHTTIVGTMTPQHVDENLQAAQRGPLPAEVYAEAKRRLSAAGEKPA